MKFLKILSLEEAKRKVMCSDYGIQPGTEDVLISEGLNRYAAETVISSRLLPPFKRSTVDGYAVRIQDVTGASESIPAMLTLGDEIKMGQAASKPISSGMAVYVPTGGMLPENADGVVMIEYTEKLDETTVLIQKPLAYGENVINEGDDLKPEEVLVKKGSRIRGLDMGLVSGAGINRIKVYKPIKIAVFSTGDEIIENDREAKFGEIYDINGYTLLGAVHELGCQVIMREIIRDDFKLLKTAIAKALVEADAIILSGGSSVGTRDFTQAAIESFEEGELLFHGISIRPGKPTMVGVVGRKLVFGLPGHPTASALVFEELVKPYILSGYQNDSKGVAVQAMLTENLHSAPGKDTFILVALVEEEETLYAKPILGKSGIFSIMTKASGYIHIASEREGLLMGEHVKVKLL